jgi:hypothetical protein
MKGLFLGLRLFSFLVVISFFLSFFVMSLGHADHSNVTSISHSPENPEQDESLRVVITLQNASEVSKIDIFVCKMDPFVCFYANTMVSVGNGTFDSTIELEDYDLKPQTVIGYNFEVTYQNGTKEKIPDGSSLQGHDNILKVGDDVYYLTLTLGDDNENNDSIGSLPMVILILISIGIIIFVLFALFVRKTKKDE